MSDVNEDSNGDVINIREDGFSLLEEILEELRKLNSASKNNISPFTPRVNTSAIEKRYRPSLKDAKMLIYPIQHQQKIFAFRKKWDIPPREGFLIKKDSRDFFDTNLKEDTSRRNNIEMRKISTDEFIKLLKTSPEKLNISNPTQEKRILGYPVQRLSRFLYEGYIPDTSENSFDDEQEWKQKTDFENKQKQFLSELMDLIKQITKSTNISYRWWMAFMQDFVLYSRVSTFDKYNLHNIRLSVYPKTIDGELFIPLCPDLTDEDYIQFIRTIRPLVFDSFIHKKKGTPKNKYDPDEYLLLTRLKNRGWNSEATKKETNKKTDKGWTHKNANDRLSEIRINHPEWLL
jgi:hypothetical protein